MRLHIPKIMALSVGLLCATGCKQDLLEQVNPNAPGTETFFTTAENAERSILAAYSGLQQIGTYSRWLHFATVLRADEGFSSSPWGELADFTRFLQSNYNFEPSEVTWHDHYRAIYRTNQIITNLNRADVQIDPNVEKQVLAEAHFIRGLLYYNLASLYGNVPLAVLPSDINYRPAQATEQQVWEQVIADLTIAKGLPDTYPNANNLGRATSGAATALLGKTYMQLRRYPDAVRELGAVVNSGRYSLAPNYLDNFTETSENNPESIFEVQFSSALEGGEQDQSSASEGSNRAQFFGPPGNGFSDGEARRWLYDEFLLERTANGGIDPRLDVTLFHNHHENLDPTRPKLPGGDTLVYGTGFNVRYPYGSRNNTRLFWRKYQTDRTRSSEDFHSPINHRVIRYADVLLLYAEALNENGQTSAAYPFINQVRQRVGLRTLEEAFPDTPLTQQQMRMQIMHERALELAGEGPRWTDLRRWQPWSTPAGLQELIRRDPDFTNFTPGKELLPLLRTDVDISGYTQNEAWR